MNGRWRKILHKDERESVSFSNVFLNRLFEPRYWYIQIQAHIIVYVSIVLLNALLPGSL